VTLILVHNTNCMSLLLYFLVYIIVQILLECWIIKVVTGQYLDCRGLQAKLLPPPPCHTLLKSLLNLSDLFSFSDRLGNFIGNRLL
jgi:hypothetical protein